MDGFLVFNYKWSAAPSLSMNGIEWLSLLLFPMVVALCALLRPLEGVGLGGMPELDS